MAAYTRWLRCAGAPRRPASGSELSLTIPSWHAVLSDPGELDHRYCPVSRCRQGSSPKANRLDTPSYPAIRFARGLYFRASLVRDCYGLSDCLPPCTDQAGIHPQPPGTFTSRLPTGRSPFPPLDMTTTASGLLCRRDLHPLEWQLASLHWLFEPQRGRRATASISIFRV